MAHYISIHNAIEKVDSPYMELTLIRRSSDKGKAVTEQKFKVVYSLLGTQRGHDEFVRKLANALVNYSPKLEFWTHSIIFSSLVNYQRLLYIDAEQDSVLGSYSSAENAKPLAELLGLYLEDEEKRSIALKDKKLGIGKLKDVTFVVGGKSFHFKDDFAGWILSLVKDALVKQNYPLNLGLSMMELEAIIPMGSYAELEEFHKSPPLEKILNRQELLPSFCVHLHRLICRMLSEDERKVSVKQMKLYRLFLKHFKVDRYEVYQSDNKAGQDKFRLLLKRAL